MRIIDADAFVEDIKTEIMNLYLDGMKGTPRPRSELYDIIDRIGEQPTVDAVVLPCKVGDELFFVLNGKIYPAVVRLLLWDYRKDKGVHSEILANPNPYFSVGASFDDFGKTVFLTRDEAEAALAKMA